jgi:glycerol-3-phosphate acyltransferase PlsY
MREAFILAISYILGSLPFGFLTAFAVKKIDIRQHGSGNIGATNVARVMGKPWGVLVFILDLLKGLAAPLLVKTFTTQEYSFIYVLAAILAICGHNWPLFLGFKGGKGVATSLGAVAGLGFIYSQLWFALGAGLIAWGLVFAIWRYVSLASLAAAVVLSATVLLLSLPLTLKGFGILLLIFIILRHRSNIFRLKQGKEHRFK